MPVDISLHYKPVSLSGQRWLELTIEDVGPGIPDDMITTLFEPYATNKARGTGLGLAIVKKIIDEHQGTVWTENQEPTGACIIIRLPLEKTTP